LGAFPSEVTSVDHIILRLTASFVNRTTPPYVIEAYRVTNSWVEADVTWNQRASGAPWSNGGGGDYDGALLGSFDWSVLASSPGLDSTTESFTMELLPGWTNAAARMALIATWKSNGNQGLLLKQQTESGAIGFLGIRTREQATSSYWPELTVYYAPAPKGTVMMFR
jgi:hypothetical protein